MKMKAMITGTFVLAVLMFGISTVNAQTERNKFELFGGYSYMNLNRGFDADEFDDDFSDFPANRVNAHGFNGSVTYNVTRYVGIKGDLTLHSYGEDFNSILIVNPPVNTSQTFKTSQNIYQYMGGLQIKDNAKEGSKFRPFAHALIGVADQHFSIDQSNGTRLLDLNSTDWAMKFGGGVDIKIHKNIDIRAIGFDWNPIVRGDMNVGGRFGTVNGVLQNNWLLNFGVVIH
jgi:hypothetical protein